MGQSVVMPQESLVDITSEGDAVHSNLAWQVSMRSDHRGFRYSDLIQALVTDPIHPALPLGIYRSYNSKSVMGNNGYVWTNPPLDTELYSSDRVFVLGDPSFGQLAHTNGLLPTGPAGLTNLISFRAARLVSR